jgi:hypothetical protein
MKADAAQATGAFRSQPRLRHIGLSTVTPAQIDYTVGRHAAAI